MGDFGARASWRGSSTRRDMNNNEWARRKLRKLIRDLIALAATEHELAAKQLRAHLR
jgi:hypothetical protein